MKTVLWLAAIYNIIWGIINILFPNLFFEVAGMEPPRYPELWQCIAMIVGVYGIGYAIAARDPIRWWGITFVGFLGKIFGPIGFAYAVIKGTFPINAGIYLVFNDLIWWAPFTIILIKAYRFYHAD